MKLNVSIISLEGDFKRRQCLEEKLANNGIKATHISAINGKEMKAIDYFSQYRCKTSKFNGRTYFTPSELGCYLSHKKALEHFISSGDDWLLVLEDDVDFSCDIQEFFKSNNFNTNSIYILGGQNGLKSLKRVVRIKEKHSKDISSVVLGTYRWLYRTCCYLISQNVAIKIMNIMQKESFMIDDWSFIMKKSSIQRIYYSSVFDHPVDLSHSYIERERQLCQK